MVPTILPRMLSQALSVICDPYDPCRNLHPQSLIYKKHGLTKAKEVLRSDYS